MKDLTTPERKAAQAIFDEALDIQEAFAAAMLCEGMGEAKPKLKPILDVCPKCGSDDVHVGDVMQDNPHREWMQANCESCQFEGSEFPFDTEADEEYQAKADAIREWNNMPRPITHPQPSASGLREYAAKVIDETLEWADYRKEKLEDGLYPKIESMFEGYAQAAVANALADRNLAQPSASADAMECADNLQAEVVPATYWSAEEIERVAKHIQQYGDARVAAALNAFVADLDREAGFTAYAPTVRAVHKARKLASQGDGNGGRG